MKQQIDELKTELKELEDKRQKISEENDLLKSHASQFESEKAVCQQENERAARERDSLES